MKALYLDQVGGASGNMFLGVLIGLGVAPGDIEAALSGLGLPAFGLRVAEVRREGVPATHVEVTVGGRPVEDLVIIPDPAVLDGGSGPRPHPGHRSLADISRMIQSSGLPGPVVEKALAVFRRLGEAEAREHGVSLDRVHFHEIGGVDSIVDIVGTCWGLHALGVSRIVSSPFVFGHGVVRMAHGVWPVPAPATLRLVEGQPVRHVDIEGETVTPTGAALVVTLAQSVGGELPMRIEGTAAGAGSREWPGRPNILRGFLGEPLAPAGAEDEVEVLEAAVDDATPQVVAHLSTALLEAGALDVMTTSVLMKKGRPGYLLTVLAPPEQAATLARRLFLESTTLGIRRRRERRWVLDRRLERVHTEWGPVVVKVSDLPDGRVRLTPEFEDCLRLGREHDIPVQDILEAARRAARSAHPDPPGA